MTDRSDVDVLVVDDEDDLAEIYADMLSVEYDTRVATSGEEALEKADESVDVALLDRRMPGMHGDAVLGELRREGLDCQVAMLTAVEPDCDIVELPFDDYKLKPVSGDELLGLVATLVERATFDELSQKYFRLVSKKAALELADEDGGDEYEELLARIEEVRTEMDAVLDNVGAEGAFKQLSSGSA